MPYIRYLIPEITYLMPICRTSMVVFQVNLFHIAYLTTEPYHGIFDWVISTGYYPACGRRKTVKIKGGSAKIPSLLSNQTISGLLVLLATSYLFLSQPETRTRAVNASGGAAHKLTWCCSSFLPKIFLSLSTGRLCQTRKGVPSQVIQRQRSLNRWNSESEHIDWQRIDFCTGRIFPPKTVPFFSELKQDKLSGGCIHISHF